MSPPRILVVGAGPAGICAAATLAAADLKPTVIDEAPRGGGQIYRRPPPEFVRTAEDLYGFEAPKAARLHATFDSLGEAIDYRPETLVWSIWKGEAFLRGPEGGSTLGFDAVLLATGAMDRVIPFPGWTTPGVYTLGAAQVAFKYQACAIGSRVALLGTGPLLYLVGYQYAKHGVDIAAVLETASFGAGFKALPDLVFGGRTFVKGLYYQGWLHSRGIPIHRAVTPLGAEGDARLTGLRYRSRSGKQRRIACDALAVGYGLKSETQLADLLGCRFVFDILGHQWLPEIDSDGRSSVKGVYLAGDGAGIGGADAAERRGELAALALMADHGLTVSSPRVVALRRQLARLQRFRQGLERAFPFPKQFISELADEVLLCRCEAVAAGEYRAAARDLAANEMNRAKALTRVGMGRCQGRVCGPAAAEILAAALDLPTADVSRLRGQAPVKPLPIEPVAT